MKSPTQHLLEVYQHLDSVWTPVLSSVHTVEIVSTKDIKAVNLKQIKPKPKNCYLNALAVCMRNHDVKYVEGYIEVHGVPLEHAWNCYKGIHFDVTEEVLNTANNPVKCVHQCILILDCEKVFYYASTIGMSGPYILEWLREKKRSQQKMA
jgi:hypothetical protein